MAAETSAPTATGTDPQNCGSCGTACGTGQTCIGGSCQPVSACTSPNTICQVRVGGQTTAQCVDTQTDPPNCGGCNQACGRGELCAQNQCTAYAPVQNAGCNSCPCANAGGQVGCGQQLGFASCCTVSPYGDVCLDAQTCP